MAPQDWHTRLLATGLLDTLAPYAPVVVGAYPLGLQAPGSRIEVVCRATDLVAFARVVERAYGGMDAFELHPGRLDEEEAVFAEFDLDGLPLEVAAQGQHTHRRLGAATLGIARMLEEEGERRRRPMAAAIARGEDWLDVALEQTGLTRAGLEHLAGANPAVARRVLGVPGPPIPLRQYVLPILVGFTSMVLIVIATAARGSSDLTGPMLVLESGVLGALFGTRLGLVASLTPVLVIGLVVASSVGVGSESCAPDCAVQFTGYTFVAVLVAGAAGVAGLVRDRYFPRAR
jgi:hypothetical protein